MTQQAERAGSPAELRIALVCYGGVSLAIYMHGVTKELHKLVEASRAFGTPGLNGKNPYEQATDTRWAYFETLRDLAEDGRPISVTIDIIAGTSAGGINGVCLAKVLATGGSQDELAKLWIKEADIEKLLVTNPPGKRLDIPATLLSIGRRWNEPYAPLKGDHMSRLLYDAIAKMDGTRSLLPDGGSLDLYVTTTDLYGFPVLVPTGAGGASQRETNHSQVLEFSIPAKEPGRDDFGPGSTAALAFAARATSSFPGAFKPVSISSFWTELQEPRQPGGVLGDVGERLQRLYWLLQRRAQSRPRSDGVQQRLQGKGSGSDIARHFRRRYSAARASSDKAWFVDGGVLDNAPFDLAVQAIAAKPAAFEVLRRLIYIQPDPGVPPGSLGDVPDQREPDYATGALKAAIAVRGSHSILPDLLRLRDLNLRIAAVADLADLQTEQVEQTTEAVWKELNRPTESPWDISDPEDVRELANAFHRRASAFLGAGYPGYCQLKVESVTRVVAAAIAAQLEFPAESSEAAFVRASLGTWARANSLDANDGFATTQLEQLLGPIDTPYRERRLNFILAGINDLYGVADQNGRPRRAQLDAMKQVAWRLLDNARRSVPEAVQAAAGSLSFLRRPPVYGDPEEFARDEFQSLYDAYAEALTGSGLDGTSEDMWQAFVTNTVGWSENDRKRLLTRYLAFPMWDALLYPTLALSELPQYTPIEVSQFSPLAATAIPWVEAEGEQKLRGTGLGHFAAFTDIAFRENDYLWGRLDGAELILRTLRGTARPEVARISPADRPAPRSPRDRKARERLRQALRAVRDSERKSLTNLPDDLIPRLSRHIEAVVRTSR